MKKAIKSKNNLIIYQSKGVKIEVFSDFKNDNIWTTQSQIAKLFCIDQSVVSRHIQNLFKESEIEEKGNMQKMHNTSLYKPTFLYSLDVVLGVGYRTNSYEAVEFRRWATKTLREHITKGYTINRAQITKNYDSFIKSVEDIQNLLPENVDLDTKSIIELIKEFSSTWLSLSAYDSDSLSTMGTTKKSVKLTGEELKRAILNLRMELIKKGEATEIFAQEKTVGSIEGIVGNVMQSFNGKEVYKTVEEKAVHLLYFLVKDHPFVDGNKRSGAFAFIWFLRKAKAKKFRNINPSALTALTLLIAESNPNAKDKMIALVGGMLR